MKFISPELSFTKIFLKNEKRKLRKNLKMKKYAFTQDDYMRLTLRNITDEADGGRMIEEKKEGEQHKKEGEQHKKEGEQHKKEQKNPLCRRIKTKFTLCETKKMDLLIDAISKYINNAKPYELRKDNIRKFVKNSFFYTDFMGTITFEKRKGSPSEYYMVIKLNQRQALLILLANRYDKKSAFGRLPYDIAKIISKKVIDRLGIKLPNLIGCCYKRINPLIVKRLGTEFILIQLANMMGLDIKQKKGYSSRTYDIWNDLIRSMGW